MVFQELILDFLNSFPDLQVEFPNFFHDFLLELVMFLNFFIVFEDFAKLLALSVVYSFVSVCFALAHYFSDFALAHTR